LKRGALKDLKLWVGVSLSVLFSFLALKGVDLRGLVEVAKRANLLPLSMAFFLAYAILWVRARRWGILLRPLGSVNEWLLYKMTLLGFLANYLLPARMGELLRAIFLGSRTGNSASSIFGTVVVERLLDLGSILLVFFIVTFSAPFLDEEKALKEALQATAFGLVLVGAGMTAFLWLLKVRREETIGIFSKTLGKILPKLSSKLVNLLSSFSQGLEVPRGRRDLGEIAIWTIAIWTLSATVVFLVSESLGLGLAWGACWFVLVVLGLGVSLPSAPGFIGTFHYAAMASVMAYGVGKTEALSFALLLHAICILPVMVLGLPVLWAEGMGLRAMTRSVVREDVKDA
jgi:uncharacterized protein (TIRG00374 family)